MKRLSISRVLLIAALCCLGLTEIGCGPYFNLFFNARKSFNEAEGQRKRSPNQRTGGRQQYEIAIDKAQRVVEDHPNSKYYDDALYILGVSYFFTDRYSAADRRLRELLANFPESEYVPEARFYLAKAKLELGDTEEANSLFAEILNDSESRTDRAAAAIALGYYHQDERNFSTARGYFQAVRDSLGSAEQKREAQLAIADGYRDAFDYNEALGAYLQVLGLDPTTREEYIALFNAADAAYRVLRVDDGQAYLKQLIDDERYFDSLSTLRLKLGEGYEIDQDMIRAEETYSQLATTTTNVNLQAEAWYRMGLIAQFDFDDLEQAEEYYDKAVAASRGSEAGREALKLATDIGKIEQYRLIELDTGATREQIDRVTNNQFLLAELYWFGLDNEDTAIIEMRYLVDSLPVGTVTPQAIVALADMVREHESDTATADSLLRRVVREFPRDDVVADALEQLGLKDTPSDTGYGAWYQRQAERWLIDTDEPDSARWYYQKMAELFPETEYAAVGELGLIWVEDQFNHPGDSTILFAYQAWLDSNSNATMARDVRSLLLGSGFRSQTPTREDLVEASEDASIVGEFDDPTFGEIDDTGIIDYGQQFAALFISPDGDTIVQYDEEPTQIDREFEFPVEAVSIRQDDFQLWFQIKLDFTARVVETRLLVPTESDALNARATETVASMTFDPIIAQQQASFYDVPESPSGGRWFVYQYIIVKPEQYR